MKNKIKGNKKKWINWDTLNKYHATLIYLILSLIMVSANSKTSQISDENAYFMSDQMIRDDQKLFSAAQFNSQFNKFQDNDMRKLAEKRQLYFTDVNNENYVQLDESIITELQINEDYRYAQNTFNATFILNDFSSFSYIYIEFVLDNLKDIPDLTNYQTPRLYANFQQPSYFSYPQQKVISRFFDSNGYYTRKYHHYLLISKEQFPQNTNLYITLLLDQTNPQTQMQQAINYKYSLKVTGNNSYKPCPFNCSPNLGQCYNGVCKCSQYQIDEDCSQWAQKVEMNQSIQNQLNLKRNVISYMYMNIDQLLLDQQLKVTITSNNIAVPICILYQQLNTSCSNQTCTHLPTLLDYNSTLCFGLNTHTNVKEFILTDGPIAYQKGSQIIIGVYQSSSDKIFATNVKLSLTDYICPDTTEYDDIVTIISIVCSFLITFTLVFICFQYCKSRNNEQFQQPISNNSIQVEQSSISEANVSHDMKRELISKKKLDKKILDKYLPTQKWEVAKLILIKQKREITDPFSCLLCHLNLEKEEKVRVSICLHVLHEECFDQWFISKEFCPMCRREHKVKDLEDYKKGQIKQNNSEDYMFEMAKQFDMITKQINTVSSSQAQLSEITPSINSNKNSSAIQSYNFNIQNPSSSQIQMQEIKVTSGYSTFKQHSQNLPFQNSLIYYKNNPIRKMSINTEKNNQQLNKQNNNNLLPIQNSNQKQPRQLKDGFQKLDDDIENNQNIPNQNDVLPIFYEEKQKNDKFLDIKMNSQIKKQNSNNSNDINSSPQFLTSQASPLFHTKSQIGKLFPRNRLNSCSSDCSSPHSTGVNNNKKQQNLCKTTPKDIFIKEVEAEEEENPKDQPYFDKRDSFLGDNIVLNYLKEQEYTLETDNNNTNNNYGGNSQRNKKYSITSAGSDLSFFSPVNFRKYREKTINIFDNEGSLNLDISDFKQNETGISNPQFQDHTIEKQSYIGRDFNQQNSFNVSFQANYSGQINNNNHNNHHHNKNNQYPLKKQNLYNGSANELNFSNNFGQSIILQQLEQNKSDKTQIKDLLPQDQL